MGFLNPVLLWGLLLGALPILIHLFHRRRARAVPWAAMELLRQAYSRQRRKLRAREWILLAVRSAALVCLALALARPTLAGRAGLLGPRSTGAILLLDSSYSMNCHNGRETRFDAAKRLARTILSQLSPGSVCTVLTFDQEVRSPLGGPTRNLLFVEQELDRAVRTTDAGTDLSQALARAGALFDSDPAYADVDRELYLITDFQRSAWTGPAAAPDLGERLRSLSHSARLYLVDAGDHETENMGILNLRAADPLVSVRRPLTFTAQVRNFGLTDAVALTVDLWVDARDPEDLPSQRRVLDLRAGQTATVNFEVRFAEEGEHTLEARLSGDRLPADDRRYLTVEAAELRRVLLVSDRAAGEGDSGNSGGEETAFLRRALAAAGGDETQEARTEVDLATPARLSEIDLSAYQAVVLSNAGSLDRAGAASLARQVNAGLGLLIFPGDRTAPEPTQALLGPAGAGLLPAQLQEPWGAVPGAGESPAGAFQTLVIRPEAESHPCWAAWSGPQREKLLAGTRVYRAYQLAPLEDGESRTMLWFSDERPAMVERRCGLGWVELLALPASGRSSGGWSNLPAQPFFPVLMDRALTRLVLGRPADLNHRVGEPLRGRLDLADQKSEVRITAPAPIGKHELRPELTSDGRVLYEFSETDRAGFYGVRLDRNEFKPLIQAFNPSVESESDLTAFSAEELAAEFLGLEYTRIATSSDLAETLSREKQGTECWALFLGLVFLLLAAESTLAYRWAPREEPPAGAGVRPA